MFATPFRVRAPAPGNITGTGKHRRHREVPPPAAYTMSPSEWASATVCVEGVHSTNSSHTHPPPPTEAPSRLRTSNGQSHFNEPRWEWGWRWREWGCGYG